MVTRQITQEYFSDDYLNKIIGTVVLVVVVGGVLFYFFKDYIIDKLKSIFI
jgi:hypothetical protein